MLFRSLDVILDINTPMVNHGILDSENGNGNSAHVISQWNGLVRELNIRAIQCYCNFAC